MGGWRAAPARSKGHRAPAARRAKGPAGGARPAHAAHLFEVVEEHLVLAGRLLLKLLARAQLEDARLDVGRLLVLRDGNGTDQRGQRTRVSRRTGLELGAFPDSSIPLPDNSLPLCVEPPFRPTPRLLRHGHGSGPVP